MADSVDLAKHWQSEVFDLPVDPHTAPADFDADRMPILARHWFGVAPAAERRAA